MIISTSEVAFIRHVEYLHSNRMALHDTVMADEFRHSRMVAGSKE